MLNECEKLNVLLSPSSVIAEVYPRHCHQSIIFGIKPKKMTDSNRLGDA